MICYRSSCDSPREVIAEPVCESLKLVEEVSWIGMGNARAFFVCSSEKEASLLCGKKVQVPSYGVFDFEKWKPNFLRSTMRTYSNLSGFVYGAFL